VSGRWEPFGLTRRLYDETEQPPKRPSSPPPSSSSRPAAAGTSAARPPQRREPARKLVVITCMDARIDPLRVLGLRVGDAHVIRNAGATVSDDVLRSLHVSQSKLGTRRAIVMGHTDCAGYASDEAAESAVRDGLRRIRGSSAVPDAFSLDGLLYDVRDGTLRSVD
jgi:carbonic anhydrase